MTKKTTREHYEKYAKLSAEREVTWSPTSAHLVGLTFGGLYDQFLKDPVLNNVPLHKWDALAMKMSPKAGKGLSLGERVCLQKHCAIYQCLGVTPEFTDEKEL